MRACLQIEVGLQKFHNTAQTDRELHEDVSWESPSCPARGRPPSRWRTDTCNLHFDWPALLSPELGTMAIWNASQNWAELDLVNSTKIDKSNKQPYRFRFSVFSSEKTFLKPWFDHTMRLASAKQISTIQWLDPKMVFWSASTKSTTQMFQIKKIPTHAHQIIFYQYKMVTICEILLSI